MAANIARAERKLGAPLGDNELVGPGAYDSAKEKWGIQRGTGAPFLSLSERKMATVMKNKNPGPGQYEDTEKRGMAAAAESVFRSNAPRLAPMAPGSTEYVASTVLDNPGPGSYNAHKLWDNTFDKQKSELHKRKIKIAHNKDAVKPINSQDNWRKTVPSVPDQYQQRDEILQEKVARPQSPPREKPIEGVDFHKSSGRNKKGPKINNPGPGTYELVQTKDTDKTETPQFRSKTQLPYQKPPKEQQDPGPGEYHEANSNPKTRQNRMKNDFGTHAERVGWQRGLDHPYSDGFVGLVPGPGQYRTEIGDAALQSSGAAKASAGTFVGNLHTKLSTKKSETVKFIQGVRARYRGIHNPATIMVLNEMDGMPLHAFNSSDVRACNRDIVQKVPPPGHYFSDIHRLQGGMSAHLEEKASVGRKGIFGSRQDRFFRSALHTFAPEDLSEGYDLKKPKNPLDMDPSSMFQSTTARFDHDTKHTKPTKQAKPKSAPATDAPAPPTNDDPNQSFATEEPTGKKKHQTPGPGSYNLKLDPNYRSPFRMPKTQHLSFGTGAGRFGPTDDNGEPHSNKSRGPGPAAYSVKYKSVTDRADYWRSRPKPDHRATMSLRPNNVVDPGPGTYELRKSMLKKSFNVTENLHVGFGRGR